MAFNIKTFYTRTFTGIVFAVIMLAGLLINHWTFFILFSVIHFGCWIEYQKLVGFIDKEYQQITSFHKYGVMLAGWCIMLYFTNEGYQIFGFRLHELGWWIGLIFVFILPITELLFSKTIRLKNIGHSFFGLIYISLSLSLVMDLYKEQVVLLQDKVTVLKDYFMPMVLILSLWVNDTMAYLIGSWIGKTSLSKISPKKTWEGTIGGIILCVGVTWIVGSYIRDYGHFTYHIMMMAGIAAVAGTFGDLLQSKLKRLAGVKDSGSIMPGHGGFLDRFDSLLLAIPFAWLYMRLFI